MFISIPITCFQFAYEDGIIVKALTTTIISERNEGNIRDNKLNNFLQNCA